jgi:hypothetical protein
MGPSIAPIKKQPYELRSSRRTTGTTWDWINEASAIWRRLMLRTGSKVSQKLPEVASKHLFHAGVTISWWDSEFRPNTKESTDSSSSRISEGDSDSGRDTTLPLQTARAHKDEKTKDVNSHDQQRGQSQRGEEVYSQNYGVAVHKDPQAFFPHKLCHLMCHH